jgi:anti-sigma factor RsiW
MNGPHLDNEQFASYLLDERLDSEGARHLTACPLCRKEFERFEHLVSDFDRDTLRWSEARILGDIVEPSLPFQRWRAEWQALARWAMAACVLFAMLLSVMVFGRSAYYRTVRKDALPVRQDSKKQIVSDNQVLTGVYQEITAPVTVPMEDYGFPEARSKAAARVE